MGQPPVVAGWERRASKRVLDAAYRSLLAALPLSEQHLLHLLQVRRLSPERVAAGQYRTLPASRWQREAVAAVVARTVNPDGVPGFWQTTAGDWALSKQPGLAVPVRHWDGSIRGVQIRRETGEPRYMWLTSRGKPAGAPAKAVYHVTWTPGIGSRRVWLTEGPLKADVAATLIEDVFLAVPGVQAWKGSGVVEDLRAFGVREVVLAYDADQQENPHVLKAARRLAHALRRAGLRVWVATWPPEAGKGIDDLVLSGGEPRVMSLSQWLATAAVSERRMTVGAWAGGG